MGDATIPEATACPPRLRALILSDIHFGGSWVQDFLPEGSPLRMEPSNAVSMRDNLIDLMKGEAIDCVFVAGDLTQTGKPQEFLLCQKVLREITSQIGVSDCNVYTTYGNHDTDWGISQLGDGRETKTPDRAYDRVAGAVGPMLLGTSMVSMCGPIPGCAVHETDKMTLYVLNSGFHSTHWQKYPHGRLGNEQLAWFKATLKTRRAEAKWRLLLVHHHPFNYTYASPVDDISCVAEGAEIVEAAGNYGVDLVCHGHRHHPRLFTEMQTGWKSPVTFLCAGSLAVAPRERAAGEIPNMFHVLTIEGRTLRGAAKGEVETYQYKTQCGWTRNEYSAMVPLEGCHHFGSIASEADLRESVKTVVHGILDKQPQEPVVDMPPLDGLVHDLRCIPLKDLNKYVAESAHALDKMRILGAYPGAVAIDRRGK